MKTIGKTLLAVMLLFFVNAQLSAQSGSCSNAVVKFYNKANFSGGKDCHTIGRTPTDNFYEGWPPIFYEGWPAWYSFKVESGYELTLLRRGKTVGKFSSSKTRMKTRFDSYRISRSGRNSSLQRRTVGNDLLINRNAPTGKCSNAVVKFYTQASFAGKSDCYEYNRGPGNNFYESWPPRFYEGWPRWYSITVNKGHRLKLLHKGKVVGVITGNESRLNTRFDSFQIEGSSTSSIQRKNTNYRGRRGKYGNHARYPFYK